MKNVRNYVIDYMRTNNSIIMVIGNTIYKEVYSVPYNKASYGIYVNMHIQILKIESR